MQQWMYRGIILGLTIWMAFLILQHPIATNDGPVHVAFSHLLSTQQQPDNFLQHEAYRIHLKLNPNLAVYLFMSTLMRYVSPALAESLVQVLCFAGPVFACFFALHTINPKNGWLAIFMVPLSLNQMFFFGLYNHCISTGAFFLVVGTYFWMIKAPSSLRALALSGVLVLTFLCHASGFIMAFAGVGIMSGTMALLSYLRDRRLLAALKEQRYCLAAMFAPLPLAAIFLAGGGKSTTMYGITFPWRVLQFGELHLLSVNHPTQDRFSAAALSVLLFTGFAIVGVRVLRNRQGFSTERRDQAIGVMAAAAVAFIIMLAFPDIAGGGWTHYRRFQIFPYFWALLLMAFDTFSALLTGALMTVGTATGVILIVSMITRQSMVRDQMTPLADVDRLVGNHCTVLPIMLRYRPIDWYEVPSWMMYQPLFQAASRLELTGDRVVLFNYLARLDAYPVHFRDNVEPQANLFLWKPQQFETVVEKIDLPGFEHRSGLQVDYILVWGNLSTRGPGMQQQVLAALSHYRPIYKSPDGRVMLYERQENLNSVCQANPAIPGTTAAN